MNYTAWQRLWLRRRVLVDIPFQMDFVARTAGFGCLAMLMVSAGIFYPMIQSANGGNDTDTVDAASTLLYMHEHFWPIAVACLVMVLLWSLRLSHRIAGPMVRAKRSLRQLRDGMIPGPVHTRRGDYMKSEVDCLNQACESLGRRVRAIQAAQAQLSESLQACSEQVHHSTDRELQAAFAKAMTVAREVHDTSAWFRHASDVGIERPATAASTTRPTEPIPG